MTNLTKPKTQASWQTPKYDAYPIYRHDGSDYRIVPDAAFSKLLTSRENWFWLSIGAATVAIAAVTNVVLNAMRPVPPPTQIIEKPVVVTQEKVVPTNCILFCK
jgi:hypothetical protein